MIDQEQERKLHDEWRRSLPEDDIHRLIDSFPAWLARAEQDRTELRREILKARLKEFCAACHAFDMEDTDWAIQHITDLKRELERTKP
jgi:hypothetical protein